MKRLKMISETDGINYCWVFCSDCEAEFSNDADYAIYDDKLSLWFCDKDCQKSYYDLHGLELENY